LRHLHAAVVILGLGIATPSWPAGVSELKHADLDRSAESLQRGAYVIMDTCRLCHSLKYIRYGDLADIGLSTQEIDELRGDYDIQAPLRSKTGEEQGLALFGRVPPDLSLMAIARADGENYIYSLLTGFYETGSGGIDNHVFPGIAMPDVLGYSSASDSGARAEIESRARDATAFLAWAADPHTEERHRIGYGAMAYIVILTLLLYLVKRRIWSQLDHGN